MIDFNKDKARKIYRKDINEQSKRVKIVKFRKGRTTKIYAINIERKRLLKQRKEKVLQNAKDRKLAKGNPLVALQASLMTNSASNDTQSITNTDDEVIGDTNTDVVISIENTANAAIDADNTDNAAIDADNTDNAATDADNTDNAAIDADNTGNAATDSKKTDDAARSNNNTDNVTTDNGNIDNPTTGKTSTVHVPLPPCYGGKAKDQGKIKTFIKYMPAIAEPSTGDPLPDDYTIAKASGHTVDLTDVRIYMNF